MRGSRWFQGHLKFKEIGCTTGQFIGSSKILKRVSAKLGNSNHLKFKTKGWCIGGRFQGHLKFRKTHQREVSMSFDIKKERVHQWEVLRSSEI